jgi:hypothetical protein
VGEDGHGQPVLVAVERALRLPDDHGPEAPGNGPDGPAPDTPRDPGNSAYLLDEADDDGEVDVLYLAGQRPAGPGEWLLITAVDGPPGAEFLARVLPADGRHAHGGDVLVRLADQTGHLEPPVVGISAWAVIGGLLVPVAAWDRQDPDGWPERIRATVAFAMGMLTELEEHGADLVAGQRVDLDDAAVTATVGIPAGVTFGAAGPGRQPGR